MQFCIPSLLHRQFALPDALSVGGVRWCAHATHHPLEPSIYDFNFTDFLQLIASTHKIY
jgi:hypothetical protein